MRTKVMLARYGLPQWEIQIIALDVRSKDKFRRVFARAQIKYARKQSQTRKKA